MQNSVLKKYPYFVNPAIDTLPESTGEERQRLVRRIAACVGDEAALRNILGIDPGEFANFYPDMLPPELSTDDTITSFISRFSSQEAADTPEIEEIVAAPAIDYAAMLEDEDPAGEEAAGNGAETDTTADLISSFLQAVPPKRPVHRKPTSPEVQDDSLSEGLFKLMVKNKNYAKALEIITELSLNNPKKSIYFAYQMRFLKKLIKNQENGTQS